MAGNQAKTEKDEQRRKKKECEQRRRDKIKADSVAYEAAKARERERWQKKKAEQKVKTIKDMTSREQRKQRAILRKEYRVKQQVKKRQESAIRIATENSPSTTDDESFQANVQNLREEHYRLQKAIWHFHEAGHGKGAPDGIGAYVKRTADRQVALGKDIENLETLYKTLTAVETKVDVFLVKKEEICGADELLSLVPELKTIKNTMRVHQVHWNICEPTTIYLRRLSCLNCEKECQHYGIGKYTYQRCTQKAPELLADDDQMLSFTKQSKEEYSPETIYKRPRRQIMCLSDSSDSKEARPSITWNNHNCKQMAFEHPRRSLKFFSDDSDSEVEEMSYHFGYARDIL